MLSPGAVLTIELVALVPQGLAGEPAERGGVGGGDVEHADAGDARRRSARPGRWSTTRACRSAEPVRSAGSAARRRRARTSRRRRARCPRIRPRCGRRSSRPAPSPTMALAAADRPGAGVDRGRGRGGRARPRIGGEDRRRGRVGDRQVDPGARRPDRHVAVAGDLHRGVGARRAHPAHVTEQRRPATGVDPARRADRTERGAVAPERADHVDHDVGRRVRRHAHPARRRGRRTPAQPCRGRARSSRWTSSGGPRSRRPSGSRGRTGRPR